MPKVNLEDARNDVDDRMARGSKVGGLSNAKGKKNKKKKRETNTGNHLPSLGGLFARKNTRMGHSR